VTACVIGSGQVGCGGRLEALTLPAAGLTAASTCTQQACISRYKKFSTLQVLLERQRSLALRLWACQSHCLSLVIQQHQETCF